MKTFGHKSRTVYDIKSYKGFKIVGTELCRHGNICRTMYSNLSETCDERKILRIGFPVALCPCDCVSIGEDKKETVFREEVEFA